MTREQHEPNDPFEPQKVTINDLLSAISETEYPQYILDVLALIQDWMQETLNACFNPNSNSSGTALPTLFDSNSDAMADQINSLFGRLEYLENIIDIVPNDNGPAGKEDAVIVNLTPLDYESGLRLAIDYAALFNRPNSKRVWIVSDTFVFEDVIHYSAYVDTLSAQGISIRFILVTPWGWVEMPLTGQTASRQHFLWRPHLRGTGRSK